MQRFIKAFLKRVLPSRTIRWLKGPQVDEVRVIRSLCVGTSGQMVDVGAHVGSSTEQFLEIGWSVVAYEPDPTNRAAFTKNIGTRADVQLSSSAVAERRSKDVPFFTSDVSSGISGLSQFHSSHVASATVDTVTLADDLPSRGINSVDFLKIDVEGYDFFVLRGFDWKKLSPRFVLYEFENRKTRPLGYTLDDSTAFMKDRGYHLLFSVWEPIVEYGTRHTWRGFFRVPPADVDACWGNVLCFTDEADIATVLGKHPLSTA